MHPQQRLDVVEVADGRARRGLWPGGKCRKAPAQDSGLSHQEHRRQLHGTLPGPTDPLLINDRIMAGASARSWTARPPGICDITTGIPDRAISRPGRLNFENRVEEFALARAVAGDVEGDELHARLRVARGGDAE